jgi:ADP-heptose:LPS heptosyltransferase
MTKPVILIVSAEGLERFIPALGPAAAIRAYHRDAEVVLLTSESTASFAKASPYFDKIWVISLRGTWDLARLWALRKLLRSQSFDRVYDLDASAQSALIFWLMFGLRGLPLRRRHLPWSGVIKHTALANKNAHRDAMHSADRWAAQLAAAGISGIHRPDLSWVARNVQSFNVPFRMQEPFVLVSADAGSGSSWTVSRYAELTQSLADEGITPVLAGFRVDPGRATDLTRSCRTAVNLINQVSPEDLVFLSWAAIAATGPDNGMTHLTAVAACHSVIMYDGASDPALVGQRGDSVVILRRSHLEGISVGEVMTAIRKSPKIGGI